MLKFVRRKLLRLSVGHLLHGCRRVDANAASAC